MKKLDEKVVENSSGGGFRADEGDASVEKLFNRLDELEMEEKKNAMRTHEMKMQEANSNKTSHVRFEDGCQEEESEAGSEESFVGQGKDNCIKFTHTKHSEGAASEVSIFPDLNLHILFVSSIGKQPSICMQRLEEPEPCSISIASLEHLPLHFRGNK